MRRSARWWCGPRYELLLFRGRPDSAGAGAGCGRGNRIVFCPADAEIGGVVVRTRYEPLPFRGGPDSASAGSEYGRGTRIVFCRADAEIGREEVLAHYEHQPANTPFRASHAVFVRPAAEQADLPPGAEPEMLRSRMLSLCAFDAAGMMIAADLADGGEVEGLIDRMCTNPTVAYLHAHFAARIDRD